MLEAQGISKLGLINSFEKRIHFHIRILPIAEMNFVCVLYPSLPLKISMNAFSAVNGVGCQRKTNSRY